jgi:hypothetical protein
MAGFFKCFLVLFSTIGFSISNAQALKNKLNYDPNAKVPIAVSEVEYLKTESGRIPEGSNLPTSRQWPLPNIDRFSRRRMEQQGPFCRRAHGLGDC